MPTLTMADNKTLDLEIHGAISKIKGGKAPGPDGIPIEFYKKLAVKLTPLLCKVFTEALQRVSLPPTMTEAVISFQKETGTLGPIRIYLWSTTIWKSPTPV